MFTRVSLSLQKRTRSRACGEHWFKRRARCATDTHSAQETLWSHQKLRLKGKQDVYCHENDFGAGVEITVLSTDERPSHELCHGPVPFWARISSSLPQHHGGELPHSSRQDWHWWLDRRFTPSQLATSSTLSPARFTTSTTLMTSQLSWSQPCLFQEVDKAEVEKSYLLSSPSSECPSVWREDRSSAAFFSIVKREEGFVRCMVLFLELVVLQKCCWEPMYLQFIWERKKHKV